MHYYNFSNNQITFFIYLLVIKALYFNRNSTYNEKTVKEPNSLPTRWSLATFELKERRNNYIIVNIRYYKCNESKIRS